MYYEPRMNRHAGFSCRVADRGTVAQLQRVGRVLGGWMLGVLLLVAHSAHAGFVAPSYVGQPNSTSSSWDYNGDWTSGTSASHLVGPFITVGTDYPLWPQNLGGGNNMPFLQTDSFGVPLGDLVFYIPNFQDDLPVKFMRIQFQFVASNLARPTVINLHGFDETGQVVGQLQSAMFNTDVVATNGVFYSYGIYDFTIKPNPAYERFTLTGAVANEVRQVRIDTISSVPEPGTVLLIGAGLFGLRLVRCRRCVDGVN